MSFASERAIHCLSDQFQYYWLIGYIKTPAMLKRQRFKDSKSDARKGRASKRPRVDEHDNKEGQRSDKYQDKSARYVPLPPYPQKESNRITDLGKGTKSLNHLV